MASIPKEHLLHSLGKRNVHSALIASLRLIVLALLILSPALAKPKPPFTVLVKARDIVYSPLTDRIYASVPGDARKFANSIAVIVCKPKKAKLQDSIPVGKQPRKLALSDDGRYLYVEIDGLRLQRVDLETSRIDLDFSVGLVDGNCPRFVSDMQVMPGHPETIAVSVECGGQRLVVGVYDNGVGRPVVASGDFFSTEICFGASTDTLWGYNSSTSRFELAKFKIDQQGVTQIGIPAESLLYAGNQDIKFSNGMIYTTNGRVVDPDKHTFDGRFLGHEVITARSFDLDVANGLAYFGQREGFDVTFASYDLKTYRPVDYYSAYYGTAGDIGKMIRCGKGGLAIMTEYPEPAVVIYPLSLLKPLPPYQHPQPSPINGGIRRIQLPHYDLAFDSSRQLFYASVPSWAGNIGNSIMSVNPATGSVGDAVWVGSEPWQLTVSDGGAYLYAALFGGRAIRRLRLPDLAPELRFPLFVQKQFFYREPISTNVFQMQPVPGRPESIMVAKGDYHDLSAPESDGVAIYDNGIERPLSTLPWPANAPSIDKIQLSSSGNAVYGLNTHISDFSFTKMTYDSNGVQVVASKTGVGDGVIDCMRCQNNLCFTNTGLVIDPETQTRLGRFDFNSVLVQAYPTQVIPDLDRNRVYFAGSGAFTTSAFVYAFDATTMKPVASLRLPDVDYVLTLSIWNNDQLAVSTGYEVILFPMSLLQPLAQQ